MGRPRTLTPDEFAISKLVDPSKTKSQYTNEQRLESIRESKRKYAENARKETIRLGIIHRITRYTEVYGEPPF
jgi:hypothetical protein